MAPCTGKQSGQGTPGIGPDATGPANIIPSGAGVYWFRGVGAGSGIASFAGPLDRAGPGGIGALSSTLARTTREGSRPEAIAAAGCRLDSVRGSGSARGAPRETLGGPSVTAGGRAAGPFAGCHVTSWA